MKRRTKQNVGQWPNMRDDTLKAIADELARARKKHPQKGKHLDFVFSYAHELDTAFCQNDVGRMTAVQVYALCAAVAAMAIRCMEEGTLGMKYSGNRADAPKFELTP
ncbi:MAG: hypothetical protein KGJ13_07215 [Patescibacteria group bacterium]|nr:hypothetical protein [Patescibacteria group bacterium]